MDVDLAAPAVVTPDSRRMHAGGGSSVEAPVAVDAPISVRVPPPAPVPVPVVAPVPAPAVAAVPAPAVAAAPASTEAASQLIGADAPATVVPPALLPRVRAETLLLDNQVYAAAQLIGRGLATRVVLVNVAVDSPLPDEWEILGTPIRLSRLADGRAVVTAGGRRA